MYNIYIYIHIDYIYIHIYVYIYTHKFLQVQQKLVFKNHASCLSVDMRCTYVYICMCACVQADWKVCNKHFCTFKSTAYARISKAWSN